MEEEIKQKPFYPIAPNHYFKNQSYRSSILSARKRQLNNWGLRSTKNLFINGTAGAIRLNDSGNCGNEVKFSLGACGYPIEKSVHDKIFDGMTHQGYYNPTLSEKIMVVLRDVPFVPFEITKAIKSVFGPLHEIPRGKYVSVGKNVRVNNNGNRSVFDNNERNSSIELINCEDSDASTGTVYYGSHDLRPNQFDITNLFIPLSALMNGTSVGLFTLPTGSVVWYWDGSTWITCSTVAQVTKNSGLVYKLFKIVAASGTPTVDPTPVLEITDSEINVHKKIAKLIEDDVIRIAHKNVNNVSVHSSPYKNSRAHIVRLLGTDFSSPVLEPIKTTLLNSTQHKSMKNLHEFTTALSTATPILEVRQYPGSSLKKIWIHAINAAADGVPLFWNNPFVEITSGNISDVLHSFGIPTDAMSPRDDQNTAVRLQLDPNSLESLNKKVKVECSGVFVRRIRRSTKAKSKSEIEILVPSVVLKQPQSIIDSFVRMKVRENKSWDSSNFKESTEVSESVEAIEFQADVNNIKIKQQ